MAFRILKRFLADERGTEAVEWAVILGALVVGALALVVSIGAWVFGIYSEVADHGSVS